MLNKKGGSEQESTKANDLLISKQISEFGLPNFFKQKLGRTFPQLNVHNDNIKHFHNSKQANAMAAAEKEKKKLQMAKEPTAQELEMISTFLDRAAYNANPKVVLKDKRGESWLYQPVSSEEITDEMVEQLMIFLRHNIQWNFRFYIACKNYM
ncbi:hypothetical protein RFI_16067 [Reticulomyxa filosa]|uniref:Uncharacterized protein n=1 Tax=Reticulomyxa filosa TaxID=46433 RepID=X6N4C1_RETFI|nr:hypothetical protein RFI_16067 [Reticulomyxa filosa]|eukprot:ETO21135.1 hypothetical protein RFI_16067 [Reticulomyxa filosa]